MSPHPSHRQVVLHAIRLEAAGLFVPEVTP